MRVAWAPALAALALAACASTPAAPPPPGPVAHEPRPIPQQPSPPAPAAPPEPAPEPVRPVALASLPGWAQEDHLAALAAFQAGCGVARKPAAQALCGQARALRGVDADRARTFFETNFRAEAVGEAEAPGVLTAYFAPEYEARAGASAEFSAPVRPKPTRPVEVAPPPEGDDPIAAALARSQPPARVDLAGVERSVIDRAAPDGALAWMRPEDLFFLQIQGSGVLTLPDGRRLKATYAGDNGKPFVAIARPMVAEGLLKPDGASGEAIRGWLAAHRGAEADRIMRRNPRYVFFAAAPDDGRDPPGAAGVPLPAGRALAVDPGHHAYGELYWIDASAPLLAGAHRTYRRLAMTLDTGSAIRGEVRADLYIGRGAAAGLEAGRVRHDLRMIRLTPLEDPPATARRETPAAPRGG